MHIATPKDLGQVLRESRESLGLPLMEVVRALHIRSGYLTAIESGDFSALPGKAYTRGYIKEYARYLGLDAEAVLRPFDAEFKVGPQPFFIPAPTNRLSLPSRFILMLSLCFMVGIYALWLARYNVALPVRPAQSWQEFTQMLDKTPTSAMDTPWRLCLGAYSDECFLRLRYQAALEPLMMLYDPALRDIPPLQP